MFAFMDLPMAQSFRGRKGAKRKKTQSPETETGDGS